MSSILHCCRPWHAQVGLGLNVKKKYNIATEAFEGYRVDKALGSIQRQNEARVGSHLFGAEMGRDGN